MKKDTFVRDINPFGLRMQAGLKEALDREAKINCRSLNSEIVDRLKNSLEGYARPGYKVAEGARPEYHGQPLTDIERALLSVFRKLPPEKQLALLSLFK